MKRAEALKALDDALAERIRIEFDNLALGFMGSKNAAIAAKATFARGIQLHEDAYDFAVTVITEKFKEN